MRGPFIASVTLHVLIGVAMIWASRPARLKTAVLPSATVVKLIRPKSLPSAVMPAGAVAEKPPSLEIPSPKNSKTLEEKKSKPKESTKKPLSKTAKSTIPGTGRELVGDIGTLKLAGDGFEYDFYLAVVQSKIEQNFRPPPGMRGEVLTTMLFTIKKDGSLSGLSFFKKSGNLLVDQAAERAIRAAGRFPPLPPQYEKGELSIYFEFVVHPTGG